ncbi:hypothetical protein [Thermanaeromonas sp. C210]|uniref:hypothetical protein n=1 Tax=Thermanaeromonas sp. C210 TaxID=2731925 RepID=UPI00156327F5|nr:hypothetical protein [Thermanaeromonas sp. C210]
MELGHFAVPLVNRLMQEGLSSLVQRLGLADEEETSRYLMPLCVLAFFLAGGRGRRKMEALPRREDVELETYLNGDCPELWAVWNRLQVLPFYAKLPRANAFGWHVRAADELGAATAELTLAFMHGVRQPFKACKKHVALYHEECPICKPEEQLRKRFLSLLRQHKSRLLYGAIIVREWEYTQTEIERIARKARTGSVQQAIREYYEVCREAGLPTGWYSNYRPFLKGE